jgi:hypothetical protein
MMLSQMRAGGIHTVYCVCPQCRRQTIIQVDGLPGDVTLTELGKALRCPTCEAPERETQPNWRQAATQVLTFPAKRGLRA